MDELRKTQNLLCPFVRNGHEYNIDIFFYTETGASSEPGKQYSVSAVSGGGIYLTNNPLLSFNDENNSLTLSEKPVFSENGVNSTEENSLLDYSCFAMKDDGSSYGGGGRSQELTYDISYIYNVTAPHFGLTGDLPIRGIVHSLLNYGQMEWLVGVAKTEDVIVSFN